MENTLENKVPVAEQVNEIEQVDEAISTEYSLANDGTIEQIEAVESPEGSKA